MPVMKENFLRNAHDTTFSPTGLYNFVSGSEGVDASGNNKHLTEAEIDSGDPTDDVDFIGGSAEGLSHFTLYRNDSTDFQYTGSMSYCCLIITTGSLPDSANGYAQLGICDGGGNGDTLNQVPQRFALQITNTGHIRYGHHNQAHDAFYAVVADRRIRQHYQWHHVAFTRDSNGTTIKLYLNGEELSVNRLKYAGGSVTTIAGSALDDGPGNTGTAFFSIGDIYNYRRTLTNTVVVTSCAIYDQELSANQIKYLARKTLGYHRVQ